jgi:hypothetical protein
MPQLSGPYSMPALLVECQQGSRPTQVARYSLLKHTSLPFCPSRGSCLFVYQPAHPSSRATWQCLWPGFDPACSQVHGGSEPSEGVRSLEPAVATTLYAPQMPCDTRFALPTRVSHGRPTVSCRDDSVDSTPSSLRILPLLNQACVYLSLRLACDAHCT